MRNAPSVHPCWGTLTDADDGWRRSEHESRQHYLPRAQEHPAHPFGTPAFSSTVPRLLEGLRLAITCNLAIVTGHGLRYTSRFTACFCVTCHAQTQPERRLSHLASLSQTEPCDRPWIRCDITFRQWIVKQYQYVRAESTEQMVPELAPLHHAVARCDGCYTPRHGLRSRDHFTRSRKDAEKVMALASSDDPIPSSGSTYSVIDQNQKTSGGELGKPQAQRHRLSTGPSPKKNPTPDLLLVWTAGDHSLEANVSS
jgi:hypothetical protein